MQTPSLKKGPEKLSPALFKHGSGDRISFDSLMLAQDKFTCQIFDLRFKQLT
jgi:hypothetical protein